MDSPAEDRRTSVERLLRRSLEEDVEGRPLSRRARQTRRSIETYLRAGLRPRWMERLAEVDASIASQRRHLERAHCALEEQCRGDAALFERRWLALAHSWEFEALNELIEEHNEWYPVERDLPMDPRTRDYILIAGRSYRRPVLGPEWVLEHFPPVPRRAPARD